MIKARQITEDMKLDMKIGMLNFKEMGKSHLLLYR